MAASMNSSSNAFRRAFKIPRCVAQPFHALTTSRLSSGRDQARQKKGLPHSTSPQTEELPSNFPPSTEDISDSHHHLFSSHKSKRGGSNIPSTLGNDNGEDRDELVIRRMTYWAYRRMMKNQPNTLVLPREMQELQSRIRVVEGYEEGEKLMVRVCIPGPRSRYWEYY